MDREQVIIDVFIERELIKEQYVFLMEKYINLKEKHVILSDKYTELDDAYEIEGLMHAENFRCALCDIGNYLRLMARGKIDKIDDINEIYDSFFELMKDNGLDRSIIGF